MAIPRSMKHFAGSLSGLATLSVVLLAAAVALSKSAGAQYFSGAQVSGHVGVAFPLVTFTTAPNVSSPTTIANDLNVNLPFGLGVKPLWSPVVFDLELVPEIHSHTGAPATFLVHPGVVLPLSEGWAIGLRAAFEIDQNSYGFTPLVIKGFPNPGSSVHWFVEGDLPVRFSSNGAGGTSVTFAIHTGLAF